MEGLGSLLLFAALFYVMMRFGCGAHAVHGRGGGHAGHDGDHTRHGATAARDPVCGMAVEDGRGYTTHHAGRAYRLCSRACLDKFEATPDQFAARGGVR